MCPDRNYPLPGDVVELGTGDIAAISTLDPATDTCCVSVLTGFSQGDQRIPLSELEYNLETGRGRILAAGCDSPEDRWWVEGRTPPTPQLGAGDLTFEKAGSRTRIDGYLEHPLVDHDLGSLGKGKVMFIATAGTTDSIAAVAVLDRPARAIDDYQRLTLARFASHPAAPANTASWMLSRICNWLTVHGYRSLRTFAGVSPGNSGTIYQASGFTEDGTAEADGSGYTNRQGRTETRDFTRRRYYNQLSTRNIHIPDPDTDLEVPIPPSHQSPLESLRAPNQSIADLSGYLNTNPSRRNKTLNNTSGSTSSDFLSPDTVGLVDFEHNLALFDALANELPIIEQSTAIATGGKQPTDRPALATTTPEPVAAIGAHENGRLTTALSIHRAGDLVSSTSLPSDLSPDAHVVTGYATAGDRGRANVAAWLLAAARTRAAYEGVSLVASADLTSLEPARKRANIPSSRLPPGNPSDSVGPTTKATDVLFERV